MPEPTPAERVDLFAQQAAELRDLRAQLAEAKRRECTALCSDVEMDRDILQRRLDEAKSELRILGIERGELHREFTKAHAWGQRRWNAWRSARRRAVKHADQRDAWRHLAETDTPVPIAVPGDVREETIKALSRVLLDSGGRLVPKHIAETARAVQESADAVLRVPVIAEALTAAAAVERGREMARYWITCSKPGSGFRVAGEDLLAALDPQEQRQCRRCGCAAGADCAHCNCCDVPDQPPTA